MSMKLKPVWLSMALACAWWSTPSTAQEPVGDAVEVAAPESVMTMRVDGEVVFDTQGKVIEYKVITPDLEAGVHRFASEQLGAMRFEPVSIDGKLVNARTFARMTLLARPLENGNFEVGMESVHFFKGKFDASGAPKMDPSEDDNRIGEWTVASRGRNPGYPIGLMKAGISGAVAVRLLLREDGTVEDAFITQSALFNVRGRDATLDKARALFERESIKALKQWRFKPPAGKPDPGNLEWRSGDIAVFFTMIDYNQNTSGQWRREARGPKRVASWEAQRDPRLLVGISAMNGDDGMMSPDLRIRRLH